MKPIIAITMGDPAGIGPEITLKMLRDHKFLDKSRLLVIGDMSVLEYAKKLLSIEGIKFHPINEVGEAEFADGIIDVIDMKMVNISKLNIGEVSAMAGNAAFEYVKKAIELALRGEVDATVTNAINKEAMNLAGHHYAGHTEIYAELTGAKSYSMMLALGNLRVVHVSTHVSLREACNKVKKDRVFEVIRLADAACRQIGIINPKVGVAGLNPHCGEDGLFGMEEIEEITPAIEEAKKLGINVEGPIPADTIFSKAKGGWFDIVVAMYHDQGHIPLKVIGFNYNNKLKKWDNVSGVNITLGLPIIRVSVDHGTAFDKAGKGEANYESLKSAVEYAIDFANNKKVISKNGGDQL